MAGFLIIRIIPDVHYGTYSVSFTLDNTPSSVCVGSLNRYLFAAKIYSTVLIKKCGFF